MFTEITWWIHRAFYSCFRPATVGTDRSGRGSCSRTSAKYKHKIYRDRHGEIRKVRIGRWRTVSATPQRRITLVKQIDEGQRIALQIELADPISVCPVGTIWEFYDPSGRLESMLQSTEDSCLWIQTRCQSNNVNSQQKPHSGDSSLEIPAWA